MAAVTVMTGAKIKHRKVERRLVRAGLAVVPDDGGLRVSRHGRWDVVTMTIADLADLSEGTVDLARRLLGLAPRAGVTCSFEGPAGRSDAWPTVVDIARAVAAEVPLAVLDDHAGTTYLVHPTRGLIAPAEYERVRGRASTSDILRRLLGG